MARLAPVKNIRQELADLRRAEAKAMRTSGPLKIEQVWRVHDGRSDALVVLLGDELYCWECARSRCVHVDAVTIKRAVK